MNIHHLELFFHVARHKGISAAARRMPYGIQQPAISSQLLQLESTLGVALFVRRPFRLTREGELLYEFILPFFSGLDDMARHLRGGCHERIHIAAPMIVQRDYLPELIERMRGRVPDLQFTLRHDADWSGEWGGAAEAAISLEVLAGKPGPGLQSRVLGKLPMVLFIPEASKIRRARQLWENNRGSQPLICMSSADPASRAFLDELRKREILWPPSLELASLELAARYAAAGHGVALGLRLPGRPAPPGLRALELPGFPALSFAAVWAGELHETGRAFLEEAAALATELWSH